MENKQYIQGDYVISTNKAELDIEVVHQFISHSYWAKGIPLQTMQAAIDGSMCFGLYLKQQQEQQQIGFARMVTDNATFAYLADVFILPAHRGQGLSKWLMECMMAHPSLQGLRRIMLATADAHGLYQQFDFTPLNMPDRFMQLHDPDVYKG